MSLLKKYFKNKMVLCGFSMIVMLILISLLAPWLSPYDPNLVNPDIRLSPPSSEHIFGTDSLGRDVFSRVLHGAAISLKVGFIAVGISVLIGLFLGALAGYYGGLWDRIIMIFCDIMLCIPTMFLILTVIAMLSGPSIWNIMIIIGLTSWVGIARLVRAEFMALKGRDFVLSAKAMGASTLRLILVHLIPNAIGPVIVSATLGISSAILTESALSFLGLGVQPPTPSWGSILTEGKTYISKAWWLSVYPGLAIVIAVLSYNILGEGLREVLIPKSKYRF